MSVLTNKDLIAALTPAEGADRLVVTPILDPKQIGPASIDLRLGPDIALALVDHEGELGRLLALSEATERGDFEQIESELARLRLSIQELQQFEHAAYAWLHALQQTLLA